MIDIQNYITLSPTATSIKAPYADCDEFYKNYKAVHEREKRAYLRHYIVNNTPYIFKTCPLLYEQLTQYLADKLGIAPSEVKLIGSAKTGFSISNPPNYGMPFSKASDLDFSVINEDIFLTLQDEFESWADQYRNKSIAPKNLTEKSYWDSNLIEVPSYQLPRGLIDTYKIPNWFEFQTAQKIKDSLSRIVSNLKTEYSVEVKGASARVYRSWGTFIKQLKLNTDSVLDKLQ